MRGSALIVHSMDPETLDRMDDLESLDPESEDENDRYKEIDELKNSHHHNSDGRFTDLSYDSSKSINSSYSSTYNENSSSINVGQPIFKSNTTISHPIFNPLSSPLSSSPPLIKSHYEDTYKENYYNSSHTSLN